ncbi:HTTM domain-containing protein [Mesorhizobium sp. KR9-304]|uniref:HTTM domain-containing protein n=1 Tax=Mesorhizobium sp. KR9-304 TaxID=3156614 RepID=UPI0032B60AB8
MPAPSDTARFVRQQLRDAVFRLADWAANSEGSSRSSALIRIGLAALFWARLANEMILYKDQSAVGLLLSLNFFIATTALMIGFHSRTAALWAGIVGFVVYYFGQDLGRPPWVHHHTYLLSVAITLLALTPCGKSYSLDRYLAVVRAERNGEPPPAESGNLLGLRLIVVQMSVLYFFSAFDKTSAAFLSGARLEHIFLYYYSGSDYPSLPGFRGLAIVTAIAVVVLEYALAFGMPFARSRRYLVLPGLAFHAIIYCTLPVYTFSATMVVLYLAYFDPGTVHRLIDRLNGQSEAGPRRSDAGGV